MPTGMDSSGNGEDLMTLEAEITELQRENARVESQMLKLKSDISAMETHLTDNEKVRGRNLCGHNFNKSQCKLHVVM